MSKSKTKVINNTGYEVILKLSTGGVISKLRDEPLPQGEHYYISIDLTTTYREYWCAVQPNTSHDKVILSSDDCAQFSEVTLFAETLATGTRYNWKGTRSRSSRGNKKTRQAPSSSAPAPTPSASTSVNPGHSNGTPSTPSMATPLNAAPQRPAHAISRRGSSKCTIL